MWQSSERFNQSPVWVCRTSLTQVAHRAAAHTHSIGLIGNSNNCSTCEPAAELQYECLRYLRAVRLAAQLITIVAILQTMAQVPIYVWGWLSHHQRTGANANTDDQFDSTTRAPRCTLVVTSTHRHYISRLSGAYSATHSTLALLARPSHACATLAYTW